VLYAWVYFSLQIAALLFEMAVFQYDGLVKFKGSIRHRFVSAKIRSPPCFVARRFYHFPHHVINIVYFET
jgi:hypothetical protein